jgi:hypothetical protein
MVAPAVVVESVTVVPEVTAPATGLAVGAATGGLAIVYAADNTPLLTIPVLTAIALMVTATVTVIGDEYWTLLAVGVLPSVV